MKKASIALLIGLSFLVSPAFALDEIKELDRQITSGIDQGRTELRAEIRKYRKEVEASAYQTTLRLCWAYRGAAGLEEAHPVNDSTRYVKGSVADKIVHTYPNGKTHTFSMADSLQAWSEIAATGFGQAASSWYGFGKNTQYARLKDLGYFDLESWRKSAHLIYFLNSWGFLQGAVHCLNSTKRIDIDNFAAYIVLADDLGNNYGHLAGAASTYFLGGVVFKIIRKTLGWTLYPLSVALRNSRRFVTKPRLILFGAPTAVVLGDNLLCHLSRRTQMQAATSDVLQESFAAATKPGNGDTIGDRYRAMLLLYQDFLSLHQSCEARLQVKLSGLNQLGECREESAKFQEALNNSGITGRLNQYRTDLKNLNASFSQQAAFNPNKAPKSYCSIEESAPPRDPSGQLDSETIYREILSFMLPIALHFETLR